MEAIMNTGLLIILFVYLPDAQSHDITHINAEVNKPVDLTCAIECPREVKWSIFHPMKADIAYCDEENCQIKEPFQKRFTFPGDRTTRNISLLILSVVYNDKGFYRCSCEGKQADVKLNVVVPIVVTAHELENISLPCYGDTRRDAKNVQWKKDKQLVLLYKRESGNLTRGNGFEDQFRVSSEAYEVGDLSLHIDSVRQSDAGLYVCTIHDESIDGEPRAVLLKVEESSQTAGHGWVIFILVLISISLAAGVFLLWRKKIISWQAIKNLFCGEAHTEHHPVQDQNPPSVMEKSSTTPILPPSQHE